MKKIVMGCALSLVLSGTAFAGMAAQNTGCGLGTMLWQNKADSSMLFQAFQATTNGSFGNQTFGITSGTLNCQQPAKFVQNERLMHFVQSNMDNLAKDMAMGKGETLNTFGEMLGVAPWQQASFNTKVQANFSKIFTSEKVVLAEVIDNTITVFNN